MESVESLVGGDARAESAGAALAIARDQFEQAIAATKCHGCGCLHGTLRALKETPPGRAELRELLAQAQAVLQPERYACLGCDVCYPAVAANAIAEAFPDAMPQGVLCPTEVPEQRAGWPPLPGDYSVVRYGACVAVCTLNSDGLATELAKSAPDGLAIVGPMRTENLGIERVIRNVLANPNIRFLLLCGEDARQLIGHLPGQSFESLFSHGVDEKRRIVGARGRRPYVKNISLEHLRAFKEQVQLVSMVGEQDSAKIAATIENCHRLGLPAFAGAASNVGVEAVQAQEPQFYKPDPAGFFVVYPDFRARELVLEHYTNAGVLDCVVAGATPTAVYAETVKRGLVSQLDHAAYLGRELATAERSLHTGEPYVQDRAPGEPLPVHRGSQTDSCGPDCTSCH